MTDPNGNGRKLFLGLVFGALAGAAVALIAAPQSGEKTREQIRQKGIELQNRAEQAAAELRARVPLNGRGQSGEQLEIEELMKEAHADR